MTTEPATKPFVPAVEGILTEDLLALVSGSDRARDVLDRHGLRELQIRSQHELVADGLTPGTARRLAGAFELARRLVERRVTLGAPVSSSVGIYEVFRDRLRHLRVEQFWAILLDAKNRVVREVMISQGTLTSSPVNSRDLFRVAIRAAAAGVVLIHNHPSGDPEPSPDDRDLTRRVEAVGELVGVKVLDHIVVGDGSYVSFVERGWLRP